MAGGTPTRSIWSAPHPGLLYKAALSPCFQDPNGDAPSPHLLLSYAACKSVTWGKAWGGAGGTAGAETQQDRGCPDLRDLSRGTRHLWLYVEVSHSECSCPAC